MKEEQDSRSGCVVPLMIYHLSERQFLDSFNPKHTHTHIYNLKILKPLIVSTIKIDCLVFNANLHQQGYNEQ